MASFDPIRSPRGLILTFVLVALSSLATRAEESKANRFLDQHFLDQRLLDQPLLDQPLLDQRLLDQPLLNRRSPSKRPLKVFILAGQSNMVGAAKMSTLDYIGDDPATRSMLAAMVGDDGSPREVPNTWIADFRSTDPKDPKGERFGPLVAGYGGRKDPTQLGEKIGPELTFGIYAQKALKQPILIIKTSWGGKSLSQDFRPPSAGPYRLNDSEIQAIRKKKGNLEDEAARRAEKSGVYYRLMMGYVKRVLEDIGRVCPAYDAAHGYELAGFVWFQGWNDLVNRSAYPRRAEPGGYDQYSDLLATFIRDVRNDLDSPKLPFVIGVMGTNGPIENLEKRYRGIHQNFRLAMAAPASRPEFRDNVVAVQTAPFWEMPLDRIIRKRNEFNRKKRSIETRRKKGELTDGEASTELENLAKDAPTDEELAKLRRGASDAAYHYLGCAKTMALIGKAFAEATVRLQPKSSASQ